MKNYCDICNKYYASSNSLWHHRKKYHNTIDTMDKSIRKSHICQYCNKSYANKRNVKRHENICKQKPVEQSIVVSDSKNPTDKIMDLVRELIPQVLQNRSKDSDSVLSFLTENKLAGKSEGQIAGNENNLQNHSNNHNTTNNTNNTTNNFNIISLGNENLSQVLSKSEQINILKQKTEALEAIIKYVHFGDKYPQFHNVALKDLNSNTGYQFDENEKKFIETPKDEMIMDLIGSRLDDIYDFMSSNQINIPKKTYNSIKNFHNMFNISYYTNKQADKIENVIFEGTNSLINKGRFKLLE